MYSVEGRNSLLNLELTGPTSRFASREPTCHLPLADHTYVLRLCFFSGNTTSDIKD